jgi:hypothetical protein
VPEPLASLINAIRARYDPAYPRWPPHMNLVYPCVDESQFPALVPRLFGVAATIPELEVKLTRFRSFVKGEGKSTVWLEPDNASLGDLEAKMQQCVKQQPRTGKPFQGHITVGVVPTSQVPALIAELQAAWKPATWRLNQVGATCASQHASQTPAANEPHMRRTRAAREPHRAAREPQPSRTRAAPSRTRATTKPHARRHRAAREPEPSRPRAAREPPASRTRAVREAHASRTRATN